MAVPPESVEEFKKHGFTPLPINTVFYVNFKCWFHPQDAPDIKDLISEVNCSYTMKDSEIAETFHLLDRFVTDPIRQLKEVSEEKYSSIVTPHPEIIRSDYSAHCTIKITYDGDNYDLFTYEKHWNGLPDPL